MRNWFLEKSIAVRAAIIVLAAAVVTAIGAGAYMLASRASGSNSEVTEIADGLAPLESPVITEENEEEETAEVEEPAVAVVETKETEEIELVDLSYYEKTSNKLENGTFSDKLNAWEVYSYVEDNIDYTADDGVFEITMQETGTEDWHVQLKQNSIRLEKGKWYTITFDAKSTLGRSITCAMQRDGMIHNDDWTPYANAKAYTLTSNWKTFTYTFQMNENTDNASVFILSLGTINGRKITTEHTISVDNIKLTQLADNWTDALRVGDNLIGNADFSYGSTLWDASVVAPGAATVSFDNKKASFGITNVGTVDWHVQLKQGGIKLASGQGYRLTFTVSSTQARVIKIGFMDTEYVNWYGGGDAYLDGTENQVITLDFYNSLGANDNALLMVSMGLVDGAASPAGNITFSNFSLVKCDTVSASAGGNGGGASDPNHVLSNGWVVYDHECSHTNSVYESNGVYNISITNTGSEDWHVQMKNSSITLENGKYYKMSYEAMSSVARNINVVIMRDGTNDNDWSTYSSGSASGIQALGTDWTSFESTFQMTAATDTKAIYNFALGKVNGQSVSGTHLVSIRNIKIEEVEAPAVQVRDIAVGDQVLNGNATISDDYWTYYVNGTAEGTITIENGKFVANITNCGDKSYYAQIKQTGLNFEEGAKYKVKLAVESSVAREIKVGLMTPSYGWIGGQGINIEVGTKEYTFDVTAAMGHTDAMITIDLGAQIGDNPLAGLPGEFKISGISVVKTADAASPADTPTPAEPVANNMITALGLGVCENGAATDTGSNGTYIINITDEGDQDYSVMLSQANINMELGASYELKVTASSTVERNIKIAIDGPNKGYCWYCGAEKAVGTTEQVFTFQFTNDKYDDATARLAISLGNVTAAAEEEGTVTIKNVSLVKTADAPTPVANNMITALGLGVCENGAATDTGSNGTYIINITDEGDQDYSVMLSQANINMELGASYELKVTASSTVERNIKIAIDGPNKGYCWYCGAEKAVGTTEQVFTFQFTNDKYDDATARLAISLGNVTAAAEEEGTVTIKNVSLVKTADAPAPAPAEPAPAEPVANNMITALGLGVYENGAATDTGSNGTYIINITDEGDQDYSVMLSQANINMELGASYELKVTASSTVERNIKIAIDGPNKGYCWYCGAEKAVGTTEQVFTFQFTNDKYDDATARLAISLGNVTAAAEEEGTVTIKNVSLVKTADAPAVQALALEVEPELVGACAEEEEESILDGIEELIADPEDIVAEPEDFIVDGGLDDEDEEAALIEDETEEDIEIEIEAEEETEIEIEEEIVEESEILEYIDLDV